MSAASVEPGLGPGQVGQLQKPSSSCVILTSGLFCRCGLAQGPKPESNAGGVRREVLGGLRADVNRWGPPQASKNAVGATAQCGLMIQLSFYSKLNVLDR